jgi:transposase
MNGKRGKYASGGTPALVKDYRAQLARALRDAGVRLETFVEANNSTSFPVALRTLQEHVAALEAGRAPLSAEKKSGRRAKLTEEQWAVVAGAILLSAEKTDLQWVVTWIRENLDIDVDYSTVSRHIAELQLSFRLTGGRPRPKLFSSFEYVQEYYDFIKSLHDTGFFNHDPKRIVCVDFVTNSRRLEREKTIAMVGSKQRKLSRSKPKYTNSYLVAVFVEDVMQVPALMFTYDPSFDPDGPRAAEVQQWCDEWHIDRDRIVYAKSNKSYCKESQAQVAHFKRVYGRQLQGARVLHDDGNAFKKDGELMLADGADRCVVFPPVTHGELSVLDNKVFAVAKNQWRTERGGTDLSRDDLYLLWCIDWARKEAIRSYWDHNFMLDVKKLSLAAAEERLRGTPNWRWLLEEHYVASYESWREEHGEVVQEQQWDALESYLDGAYWTK